jgi:hypothetical protein
MTTKRKPTKTITRKERIDAEIARQRAARVIHVNEPNPTLMRLAGEQIVAANLRRLEAEWAVANHPPTNTSQ